MKRHVMPVKVSLCLEVEPRSSGRSHNSMPPEAAHALEQAARAGRPS